MPSYYPENNTPQWGDNAERSLQKIATLLLESRIPVDLGGSSVNINGPVTVTNEVEVTNDINAAIPVAGYDAVADQKFPLELDSSKRLRVVDEKVLQSIGDLSDPTTTAPASTDTDNKGVISFFKRLASRLTVIIGKLPDQISGRVPVNAIFDGPQEVVGPLTNDELRATPVDVVGPLTDDELRASAVEIVFESPQPVTGPLTDDELRAAPVNVLGPLTDDELRASPVDVLGPLTDAELRATPVDVLGPLTDAELRASAVPVVGPLTDAELRATAVNVSSAQLPVALGQTTASGSLPVVLPENQTALETRSFSGPLSVISGEAPEFSEEVLPASPTRRYFFLQNLSDDPIHINFTSPASTDTLRVEASAIMIFEGSFVPQNAVTMVATLPGQKYFIAYHDQ